MKTHHLKNPNHHNFGRKASEETKEKMRKAQLGRRHSPWTKLKIAWGNEGKKLSEETKEKLRNAQTGRKMSEETKLKIGLFNKGKKLSEEHKTKIGIAQTGKIISDESKRKQSISRTGKRQTLETRKKLSKAFQGEKNPQWRVQNKSYMILEFCHHKGYRRFMSEQYDELDKQVHRILFHFECSPIFPNYKMIHIAHHIRYIKGEFDKDREWYSKLMGHIIDNSLSWKQISQEKYDMLKETLKDYLFNCSSCGEDHEPEDCPMRNV